MAATAIYQDTSAYEYPSPVRSREPQRKRQSESKRAPLRQVRALPRAQFFTWTQLAMLGLVVVCCGMILYSSMMITTMTDQTSKMRSKLADLQSAETYLKTQQENVMSLSLVEETAVQQLGMTKMDASQVEYLELSNPDQVEIASGGFSLRKALGLIHQGMGTVVEYLS